MKIKEIILTALIIFAPGMIYGEEYETSISQNNPEIEAVKYSEDGRTIISPSFYNNSLQHLSLNRISTMKWELPTSDNSIIETNNGYIFTGSSYSALKGLGNFAEIEAGISQFFGPTSIYIGASGAKNHIGPIYFNNFGVHGNITYAISNRVRINVFATFYSNNNFYSAAAMPYIGHSNYGASMSVDFNDNFSMEAGVRREYNPYSRQWETRPIVAPTFRLNNGMGLGVDIGGILYNLFHTLNGGNDFRTVPSPQNMKNSGPGKINNLPNNRENWRGRFPEKHNVQFSNDGLGGFSGQGAPGTPRNGEASWRQKRW